MEISTTKSCNTEEIGQKSNEIHLLSSIASVTFIRIRKDYLLWHRHGLLAIIAHMFYQLIFRPFTNLHLIIY